ncbi:hypothetical protein MTO98_12195 [Mucilaginibacter sp. SMC90]|uniref:hypothetical protein n=1 Tax=Mucilaginibacter sp. SMC90 TaxID=2929803 RepID=UPI001FB3536F|nr:hypothetical protein [Mucilaginibacter sp. SMC90]UOE51839.1 hypothetical protein MTO98_12195 [Mucilaginibacter sp. SMC90]
MKEEYWVFGGALLFHFGRLLYKYYQKKRYEKVSDEIADYRYDTYLELRDETFALKPEDIGIVLSSDNETAFALILEMHVAEALQAIVAFSDGKVWAFNTYNARKNIVDNDAEDLRFAAIEAVAAAQYHFARMRRMDAGTLLPGHIKIHILTNQDTYSAGGTITAMCNESSEWAELVAKVFTVVCELDSVFENKPKKPVYTQIAVKRSKPANF